MTAPLVIHLSSSESVSIEDFCERMAEEFTERYKSIPIFFTQEGILNMIQTCSGEGVLPNPLIEEEEICAAEVCQMLAKSRDIQDALDQAEQGIQPIEEPEGQEGAVEAQEPVLLPGGSSDDLEKPMPVSPLQDAYDKANAANQQAKQRPVAVLPALNSQEAGIVEAAKNATKGDYIELKELFDFGDNLEGVRAKEGVPVSPADWAKALGFSAQWSFSANWMLADCVAHLEALGHTHAVEQIAAEFRLGLSTVYNARRVAQRVPMNSPARKALDITTCSEIALPRYDKDESKQSEAINELLEEAIEGGWNASEARSHSRAKRGKEDPVEGKETAKEKIMRLEKALGDILKIENQHTGCDWAEIEEAKGIARKALGIIEPLAMAS